MPPVCSGQISEVFDGDAPHRPGGCFAQAWSVAEVLRTYVEDAKGRGPEFEILSAIPLPLVTAL